MFRLVEHAVQLGGRGVFFLQLHVQADERLFIALPAFCSIVFFAQRVAFAHQLLKLFILVEITMFVFDLFAQSGQRPVLIVRGAHGLAADVGVLLLHGVVEGVELFIADPLHDHERVGKRCGLSCRVRSAKQDLQRDIGLFIAEEMHL